MAAVLRFGCGRFCLCPGNRLCCLTARRLVPFHSPAAVRQRTTMQQTALGYGSALLATIIWSGNFVVARALATLIPPCSAISGAGWWLLRCFCLLPGGT